ncbi:MAG: DHA2 family efflux MFS transporter permease subunit, partial [Acidimicrobiales bacterium]
MATTAGERGSRRWVALALLSLGVALIIIDGTVVNVALPTMIRELDLGLSDAEWINTIYALVFAALLINLGRAGDVWGRKKLFLLGIVVFVAASVWAGRSTDAAHLIGARFAQGLGAAMILPNTLSSVNAIFTGRARAVAFAVWGSVIGGMAAIGPLLGGWLTTSYSWRWIFYVNVPIGGAVLVASLFLVPETKDPDVQRGTDAVGAVLVGLGLAALVFGLIEGQTYGWWAPEEAFTLGSWTWPSTRVSVTPVAFALAVVLLCSFVVVERARRRSGRVVVLDLDLFRLRSFRWGNTAALIVSLGEFGLVFVLPLYLQSVLQYSPLQSGAFITFIAVGAFLAGPAAARIAERFGSRTVVVVGMALEAVGVGTIALVLSPSSGGGQIAPFLVVYGVGVGLATAQLTGAILADVPVQESGQASGTQSTSRQVGSALGIAVLGALLSVTLASQTAANLATVPGLPPPAAEKLADAVAASAGQAVIQLRQQPGNEAVVTAVDDAFVTAMKRVVGIAAVFIVLGLAVATR